MYPTKKLREVWTITTWFTPSKLNKEFWGGETLFIKPPHLRTDKIITETEETLSDLWRAKWKLIKKNSIMVCCIWSLWKIGIAWENVCTNQQINSIFFDEKVVNFKYWYYFCTTLEKLMNRMANKAIIAIINKTAFSEITIPLPHLFIQSRIVEKLDEAFMNIDKQIELLRVNIEDVENMKKSVLENIFTQWNTIDYLKINDFASIKSGKRIPKWKKISDQKTQYPYIRVTDFSDNWSIDLSSIKYISKDIYEDIKNYIITSDDLYISIAWTIWKTGIIPDELNWANLTENAIRLVYKNKQWVVNKYIYYFTISENFKHQAWLATRAVAMPKLAISRLKEIKIYLPNISRQHEIVSYLDTIFDKSKSLSLEYEAQIRDLEIMKQCLLEEAFAGRLILEEA